MGITDWINDGSDNPVLHVLELPLRLAAILIWANAIIFGAVAAVAGAVLLLHALA